MVIIPPPQQNVVNKQDLDNAKSELQGNITNLENEINTNVTTKINNLQQQITGNDNDIQGLKNKDTELQNSINTAKSDLTNTINTTKNELQQQITTNTNQISSFDREIDGKLNKSFVNGSYVSDTFKNLVYMYYKDVPYSNINKKFVGLTFNYTGNFFVQKIGHLYSINNTRHTFDSSFRVESDIIVNNLYLRDVTFSEYTQSNGIINFANKRLIPVYAFGYLFTGTKAGTPVVFSTDLANNEKHIYYGTIQTGVAIEDVYYVPMRGYSGNYTEIMKVLRHIYDNKLKYINIDLVLTSIYYVEPYSNIHRNSHEQYYKFEDGAEYYKTFGKNLDM